jgi:transposase
MDNVPFHKTATIEPLIQSVGANILYMSPYSPDFNPIERKVVTTIALSYVNSLQPQQKWLIPLLQQLWI